MYIKREKIAITSKENDRDNNLHVGELLIFPQIHRRVIVIIF